jgi:tripartite-type tricarboxylate transporter receptor subunit TctC
VVVSVDQLYKHLVLTGRQTSHADCIVVTRRFHPTPRQVVDVYVQMPDPWRYVEQPFIIENRPGGGGNIAAEAVVRAPADGYTLLMVSSANAINATLYDKLNFDFIRDIAPIAGINHSTYVLAVHPSFPAKTVNMASAGIGSPPHMAGELFKMMAGVNLIHVPYRGGGAALPDLLAGQVQVYFPNTLSSIG